MIKKNAHKNSDKPMEHYASLGNVNGIKMCDMCGNRIDDNKVYPVKGEQFNIIGGIKQCEDCYREGLGF